MQRLDALTAFLREPRPSWSRHDTALAAIAAFAVLVRWSDRAQFLMTWDSHTFALALERYDVNGLRPHAPGYPVYVALGRLANAVVRDANDAFIAISLLACAAGVVLTYVIGRRLADRAVALAAMLLLLAAPLVHVHAVTANSYAADVAFSTLVAVVALWGHAAPSPRRVAVLAGVFGLAVGVRQSLALFMGPLVAWAALAPPWDLRTQARRLLPAAAVGVAVGLLWFLPMTRLSGGLAVWRRANALQSEVVFEHPVWRDGWPMLEVNADRMALYLQWELAILLPTLLALLAVAAVLRLVRGGAPLALRAPPRPARDALVFLALWGLPPLVFYLTVYSGYGNGPSGYALILLPPLFLACCLAARWALARVDVSRRSPAILSVVALVVVCVGFAAHAEDVSDIQYKEHDEWSEAWSHLPETFPASNSTIVTAYNFAHTWYYYPDYQVFEYRPAGKAVGEVPDFLLIQEANDHEAVPDWYDAIAAGGRGPPHPLRPGIEHLILFDFQLGGQNGGERMVRDEFPVREAWLPNGWRILYIDTVDGLTHLEDYFILKGGDR